MAQDKLSEKQEELASKFLMKLMKEDIVKLLQFMLVQLGKEMLSANAETMKLSQESDLNNKRYKIECKAKITLIKQL